MAARFYAPVLVTAVPQQGGIMLRAVNDHPRSVTITVTPMRRRWTGPRGSGGGDSGRRARFRPAVLAVPPEALGPGEVLAFTWTGDAQGGDVHAPSRGGL